MRSKMLAAVCVSAIFTMASAAATAPVVLFDGFVTADGLTAAPAGATASLAGPLGLRGGLQSGAIAFNAPGGGVLTVTVTDFGQTGDVFEVFADGASLGITAPVPAGGLDNSTGTFKVTVGTGPHTVDVWDYVLSYAGGASPYGGAVDDTFSPADLGVTVAFDVPEPASATLAAGWLFALGLTARRRVRGGAGA